MRLRPRPRPTAPLLLACLTLAACAHRPPLAVHTPTVALDPAVLGEDVAGLTAAAERLCATLTTRDQKDLGFSLGQRAHGQAPKDARAALALARCAGVRAETESDPALMQTIAQAGVAAAKAAGAPGDPQAAYWMAINLGLVLQQRGFSALAELPEEIEALKSAQAAADVELGGPLRALGMLYLRAPSWPAGPGDADTAVELLAKAAQMYPSHPLNHLFYAEALLKTGDRAKASAELQRAADLARPELWGEYAARWQAEIQATAAK